MKKLSLNSLGLNESSMLSADEKRKTSGGYDYSACDHYFEAGDYDSYYYCIATLHKTDPYDCSDPYQPCLPQP